MADAKSGERIVFLDYLRVIAIFMVLVIHTCEQYYFGSDGGFLIKTLTDARWAIGLDSACRSAVPLFVMASAYLLFPVSRPTGEFFRRRLLRVAVPFVIWCCIYNWWFGGDWTSLAFNFPMATGGHLWFVPMLLGLYLVMPILSPWAEKVGKRELRWWLLAWLFTTTMPFLRGLERHLLGEPSFGAIPYLYGECPWSGFGTFHYLSGFVGYMLLGFYFRKFAGEWSWRKTLTVALPLLAVGYCIVFGFFYWRIPSAAGYLVSGPYALAVKLEMSWEFCSFGVALMTIGYFALIRKLIADGAFYRLFVRPLSGASYGVYLVHILLLVTLIGPIRDRLPTPLAIAAVSIAIFALSSALTLVWRRVFRFIGSLER